jgi:hypothetical protein
MKSREASAPASSHNPASAGSLVVVGLPPPARTSHPADAGGGSLGGFHWRRRGHKRDADASHNSATGSLSRGVGTTAAPGVVSLRPPGAVARFATDRRAVTPRAAARRPSCPASRGTVWGPRLSLRWIAEYLVREIADLPDFEVAHVRHVLEVVVAGLVHEGDDEFELWWDDGLLAGGLLASV